jgi:hypothetical protein
MTAARQSGWAWLATGGRGPGGCPRAAPCVDPTGELHRRVGSGTAAVTDRAAPGLHHASRHPTVSDALGASWGCWSGRVAEAGSGSPGGAPGHMAGRICHFSKCRCLGFRHGAGILGHRLRLSATRRRGGSDRRPGRRAPGSWAARFHRPRHTDSCIWPPRLLCSSGPGEESLLPRSRRMQGGNSKCAP